METIIPKKYIDPKDQKLMVTIFEKGKKIITHPSGVIIKYMAEDLGKHKEDLLKRKIEIDQQIARIDSDITEVNK